MLHTPDEEICKKFFLGACCFAGVWLQAFKTFVFVLK